MDLIHLTGNVKIGRALFVSPGVITANDNAMGRGQGSGSRARQLKTKRALEQARFHYPAFESVVTRQLLLERWLQGMFRLWCASWASPAREH